MATPSPSDEPQAASAFHALASKKDQARKVTPFQEWSSKPITVPTPPSGIELTEETIRLGLGGWADAVLENGRDSYGQRFADLGVDPEVEAARIHERNVKRKENTSKAAPVQLEDSWLVGQENSDWLEPEGTSKSDYSISRPPFSRLMAATLDFFFSRGLAFKDKQNLNLFNIIRHHLGLSTQFPGLHWPGLGADAETYTMTHAARAAASRQDVDQQAAGHIGEVCPLLVDPENTMRGLVAMARGQGGDASSATRFAEMLAALMGFIEYYNVLPDVYIAFGMSRATVMAKAGPRYLRQAAVLEDELNRADGLNRATWTLLCDTGNTTDGHDTSEWLPISSTPNTDLTREDALTAISPLVAPIKAESIHLLKYLPTGRRRVAEIVPCEAGGPLFKTSFLLLRTVPAPWTSEELLPEDSSTSEQDNELPPSELDIWVDKAVLADCDADAMIGMGLRASWAKVGLDDNQSWWIASLTDYILPSIWQSTQAERQAAAGDPKAPWVLDPESFTSQPVVPRNGPVV